MTEFVLSIEKDGTVKLPAAIRAKYGIRVGDAIRISDFGGGFVLIPLTPSVARLAQGRNSGFRSALKRIIKRATPLCRQRRHWARADFGPKGNL